MLNLDVAPHPLLLPTAFVARFPRPLGDCASPPWLLALLRGDAADRPFTPEETLRQDVRKMLRHCGYRPTGRGKPASEYLVRAAGDGTLGGINLAVDACNAVSLHGGLPISVVDLDRARPPFRIRPGAADESYVFNQGGQAIRIEGLLCLCDADGPCANGVKDSQRTKTDETTVHTLSVVWGTRAHPERSAEVTATYRAWLERAGAQCEEVACRMKE